MDVLSQSLRKIFKWRLRAVSSEFNIRAENRALSLQIGIKVKPHGSRGAPDYQTSRFLVVRKLESGKIIVV